MNRDLFIERKEKLINLITDCSTAERINEQDRSSLKKLQVVLNQYSFENRLQKKGLLSHTIVDSLELDYSLGEKFIKFDNDIR